MLAKFPASNDEILIYEEIGISEIELFYKTSKFHRNISIISVTFTSGWNLLRTVQFWPRHDKG